MEQDIIGSRVDRNTGKVMAYDLGLGAWVSMFTVDAREALERGGITFSPPAGAPPDPWLTERAGRKRLELQALDGQRARVAKQLQEAEAGLERQRAEAEAAASSSAPKARA